MVKCPKCGKENLDDMKFCGYCGSLLEPEQIPEVQITPKEKKSLNKTAIMALAGVLVAGIVSVAVCLNSNLYKYAKAEKAMQEGNYAAAAEGFGAIKEYKNSEELYVKNTYQNAKKLLDENEYEKARIAFSEISEYEDASVLLDECAHLVDVQNDVTAPVISGIEDGVVIEAKFEEAFNLKNYLHEIVAITDDVSGGITEYSISPANDIYDAATGIIDTTKPGEHEFIISAKDEAGNKDSASIIVKIDDTIYVTEENKYPILCDNEEFGTYKLKSLFHGRKDGVNGYIWEIDIQNQYPETIYTYIGVCYINDYKVESYYNIDSIATNKKGTMTSYIYDEDLDENTSEFEYIEARFVIKRSEHGFASMDETIYSRPIIINKEVFS